MKNNNGPLTPGNLRIKVRGYSRFEKRDFPFVYLLIAFPVLQFAVFWLYVNISSIGIAFINTNGKFTLGYFQTVYNAFTSADPYGFNLLSSLKRSLITWTVSHVIMFPISVVNVYILTRKIRGHYFYRICEILPSLIGAVIWTSIIKSTIQNGGPIIMLLQKIGIELPEAAVRNGLLGSEKTAYPTLIGIQVLTGLVTNSPVLTGAFTRIPDELFESAELDGAGFWRQFYSIAIPCIWSTITTLLIFALCSIFTADCGVFLYSNGTGEPGMSTIGFQLYYLTVQIADAGGRATYGYPAALGLTLTAFTLPVCLIGRRILEKINEGVEN